MAKAPILVKAEKTAAEVIDLVISFTEYLEKRADTLQSHVVTPDAGITIPTSTVNNGAVTVFVAGGTAGVKYGGVIAMTSAGGRIRRGHFQVKVLEG